MLGEFADLTHNTIPEPDRAVDNTTIWVPDFSRDYFDKLLYSQTPGANSMRNFYIEQSSNRYTVVGDSDGWVAVPGDAVDYDDTPGHLTNVWTFLDDSLNGWYDEQIAAGKTPAQIDAYLSQFDVWDRYDYDGDGNFDEPDGYIDTFQSVHAGEGEEAGGGARRRRIWSHSWYAHYELTWASPVPPSTCSAASRSATATTGSASTPSSPRTAASACSRTSTATTWACPTCTTTTARTAPASGRSCPPAPGSDEGKDTIGNKPSHMGAWEKFQLGWLNYEVACAGGSPEHKLGPMEFNTKQAQGLFVVLPQKPVTEHIGDSVRGQLLLLQRRGATT